MIVAAATDFRPAPLRENSTQAIALGLAVLAGPWLGFLYLGLVRLSLLYIGYAISVVVVFLTLYLADLSYLAFMPYKFFYLLLVHVAGALHCANQKGDLARGKRGAGYRRLTWLLAGPVFSLSAAAFLLGSASSHRMLGPAMAPTIGVDSPFFLNSYAYDWGMPERGDIVLYTTRSKHGTITRISRIIGLPGDRVAMKLGVPVLNGVPLSERRLPDYAFESGIIRIHAPSYEETLPDGDSYAVLASNSPGTGRFDNHPERQVPKGAYFVIGDNRAVSRDSRDMAGVGFVMRDQIKGKVLILQ